MAAVWPLRSSSFATLARIDTTVGCKAKPAGIPTKLKSASAGQAWTREGYYLLAGGKLRLF